MVRTEDRPDALNASHRTAPGDIELEGVTKAYGEVRAVDDVSLRIENGEFFSLLGPSGCGKTTTLRLIAGFAFPDAGVIRIGGEIVGTLPPHRRDVNTVFQQYALFPHMTVAENVAFGLEMKRVPRETIRQRVGEMLELVGLSGYERRKPSELSGGEQQRVALARALVNRPAILLLDEPLAALDLKLRERMRGELKALQGEVGITFLYVTHDQEEAMALSDRIAVMRSGRIEQIGTPEAIYEAPRNRFVADFIGTTNFLSGTVLAGDDGGVRVRLDGSDDGPAALAASESAPPVGSKILLSLRPERITLRAPSDPVSLPNALDAVVLDRTYLGTDIQYRLRAEDGIELVALVPNRDAAARFDPGAALRAEWKPDDMRILEE